jgi:preprotein translocase subunit YajC
VEAVGALFPFVLILAAFYLLIIRPARTRQRAAVRLQSELAQGQQVMTTSGVFATVSSVEDEVVVLEVAPGVTMRFAKAAVARILQPESAASATGDADGRPEDDLPA